MISHYSADTETYAFSSGNIAPRLVCSSWSHNIGTPYLLDRNDTYDHVVTLLAGTEPLVWFNAAFDASVLVSNWPHLFDRIYEAYEDGRMRCVLIREALYQLFMGQLKDHRGDLSLANTYQRRTGKLLAGKKGGEHDWRLRFGELEGVPVSAYPKEASDYALQDATSAGEIFLQQQELPDEKNQTKAAFALYLMACTGIRANPKKVAALRGKLEQRIALASEVLIPTGIYRPSGKRNMAVIKGMVAQAYTAVGKSIPYVVPKGKKAPDPDKKPNISYAAEVLKDLPCVGEECDDIAFHVCDHPLHWLKSATEDAGELSKYVKHLEHACKAPLNYTVTSLVATGRTSISNPPLQQLPQRAGVRQCIEPPPGYYFVGADYSAIELTTFAQICLDYFGTSKLAEVIQDGLDPHLVTASMFLGWTYEKTLEEYKKEKKTESGHVTHMRNLSKALAFGVNGGLGGPTFVGYAKGWGYRFEGRTDEEKAEKARGFIREYKNWYPEVKRYLDLVSKQVDHGGGYFDLVQPRSKRIRGQVGYTNGANCVDAETEALSKTRGWVRGFDLVVGEEILTKNPVTMALEWQPIQNLHLYPDYDGPIIEMIQGQEFHAVTTPNHRWFVMGFVPGGVGIMDTNTLIDYVQGGTQLELPRVNMSPLVLRPGVTVVRRSNPCPVWCPTVANGFFIARRSGRQYLTGNSTFQGLAADLCKDALWHITRECFRPGTGLFGSRVVLFMHDEVILQSPKELAHLAGDRLSVLMLEAAKRWCPDVPTKAEPWISLCWEKEAKTVRDTSGKLLPWIPKES